MLGSNLFGEPITESRLPSRAEVQRTKAKRAYAATATAWKESVYRYAIDVFLPANDRFLFEKLSTGYEAYAKKHHKPATAEKRAFAGLQARLVREGVIEKTGEYENRSQSSPSMIYRSRVFNGLKVKI